MEWKETARWIKFEENVEDSNRWGKPHVASLTFHSLLDLKKGLEKGSMMFYVACVASVSVRFLSNERQKNGIFGFDRARNFVARSLAPVPRSLLLNRTETLATQAVFYGTIVNFLLTGTLERHPHVEFLLVVVLKKSFVPPISLRLKTLRI